MSTSKDLTSSDNNLSNYVLAFPAGRRNVQWYNSRILNDDNFRRSFEAALPSPAGNGTIILDYEKKSDNVKVKRIAFLIRGYYFMLLDDGSSNTGSTIDKINSKLVAGGSEGSNLWVYMYQVKVEGTATSNKPITDFYEFACSDDSNKFYGLFSSATEPDTDFKIPIVVDGELDRAIDATPEGDYYKPWFQSSAAWAAGPFSDKNKFWIDPVYDVPHICVKVGDSMKWIPLGAVYKTSRDAGGTVSH